MDTLEFLTQVKGAYRNKGVKRRETSLRQAEEEKEESQTITNHKKKEKKKRKNIFSLAREEHVSSRSQDPAIRLTRGPKRQKPLSVVPKERKPLPFPHRYILAPMVGASELPFRLLCRRFGAQLCYTPMISALKFANNDVTEEFSTTHIDNPLVVHVWANCAVDLAAAAVRARQIGAAALDLNLGCPQRTAYMGHFGSYLLDEPDRIIDMVRAAVDATNGELPVFCKIRLLGTLDATIELVQRLSREGGASLVAIHARLRASWERTGPSARAGPANLDHVRAIQKAVPDVWIVANGNTVIWKDVCQNLEGVDGGLMSAEGVLDNPALFLPRYGPCPSTVDQQSEDPMIRVPRVTWNKGDTRKRQKLEKKMAKLRAHPERALRAKDEQKLGKKLTQISTETVALSTLYDKTDKVQLAREYLLLVQEFPAPMRSVIFHLRRMLRDFLKQYQLMEECVTGCATLSDLRQLLNKIDTYRNHPDSFRFDQAKAKAEQEASERKRQQEGRRHQFEQRMIRKAKREGKRLTHYLEIGATVPTVHTILELQGWVQRNDRATALRLWKERDHAQHCFAHHVENCPRGGRTCAFLHADIGCSTGKKKKKNDDGFEEQEEVAG